MYQADYTGIIGGFLVFIAILWLVCMACVVVQFIGMWKTFSKAGEPGWKCLIPIYNNYTLCKIVWGCGWYFLLFAVPIGDVVFLIVTYVKLAKVFGKSGAFAVGLIFLSPIFFMILGCDNSTYTGADIEGKGKSSAIIATAILGLLWLVLFITSFAFTAKSIGEGDVHIVNVNVDPDSGKSKVRNWGGTGKDAIQPVLDLSEYGDDAVLATITNNYTIFDVPMWEGDYYYNEGSLASCSKDGVYANVSIGYTKLSDDSDLEDELSRTVESYTEIYSGSDSYTDVSVGEIQQGEGWVLQKIDYFYNVLDEFYPCADYIKVEEVNGYPMTVIISLNGYNSSDNSESTLADTCDMYGIDLDK